MQLNNKNVLLEQIFTKREEILACAAAKIWELEKKVWGKQTEITAGGKKTFKAYFDFIFSETNRNHRLQKKAFKSYIDFIFSEWQNEFDKG